MSGSRRLSPWARALLSSAIGVEKRRIDRDGVGVVAVSVALILQGIRGDAAERRTSERSLQAAEFSATTVVASSIIDAAFVWAISRAASNSRSSIGRAPSPLFFVSADSNGLNVSVSPSE